MPVETRTTSVSIVSSAPPATGTVTSAKGTTLFVVSLPASEGVKKKNVKGLKEKNLKLLPPAPPEPGV